MSKCDKLKLLLPLLLILLIVIYNYNSNVLIEGNSHWTKPLKKCSIFNRKVDKDGCNATDHCTWVRDLTCQETMSYNTWKAKYDREQEQQRLAESRRESTPSEPPSDVPDVMSDFDRLATDLQRRLSISTSEQSDEDARERERLWREEGRRGQRGPAGLGGERGPAGLGGERGPAGLGGERGRQGPVGLGGERGRQGERGLGGERGQGGQRGLGGRQGPAGLGGERGRQGPAGLGGERGLGGQRGPAGRQGERGVGERGPAGPAGPAGNISIFNILPGYDPEFDPNSNVPRGRGMIKSQGRKSKRSGRVQPSDKILDKPARPEKTKPKIVKQQPSFAKTLNQLLPFIISGSVIVYFLYMVKKK
jgi:hypothetical protein